MVFTEVPLIKDSVAELSSESHPVDNRKSWIFAAQQRPRVNRPSRSSRAGNSASLSPSDIEIGPVVNKSRPSYAAPESSFLFSRRARAFRTYFVQRLDDYQFFTPFSHRTLPAETLKPSSTPASSDRSPSPTLTDNCDSDHPSPSTYNDTTLSFTPAGANPGLQHPLHPTRQQACRSAIGSWEPAKQSQSGHALGALIQSASKYMESILSTKNATAELPSTLNQNQESPTTTDEVAGFSAATKEHTTDAAGRPSPELRGSCMAVVVGLVAGIMWF